MKKKKTFHIETFDEGTYLNFFTEAKDKKSAMNNLLTKSQDFKNLANESRDWVIKVKELK